MLIFYTCQTGQPYCQWHHQETPWYRQLWPEDEQILLNFPYLYYHCFVDRHLMNHYIKFGGKLTSPQPKMTIFPQLSNWQPYCQWHHWGNPLNYNFYIHQYWFCDIDFLVISTQNDHGKRIIIARPECI